DPADQQRAGFVLRVWHRSEMRHGGLLVLAPKIGDVLQGPVSAEPEGRRRGGGWRKGRHLCATPCLVGVCDGDRVAWDDCGRSSQMGETDAKAANTGEHPD